MSRDIRSFFTVAPKKGIIKVQHKAKAIIDDSDEDVIPETPKQTKKNRKIVIDSSSDEEEKKSKGKKKSNSKEKSKTEPKLKPVDISNVYNSETIKQSKVEKPKKLKLEGKAHQDEDFEKTLLDLDDDFIMDNVDVLDKTIEEALHKDDHKKQGSSKENSPNKKEQHSEKKPKKDVDTPSKGKKRKLDDSFNSSIDPGQAAWEKKRQSAMLYQQYKNRGAPKNQGQKEYPEGIPTALSKLTFLRTGVLDSLDGTEFEELIEKHGGRVVHSVSKKVNYLIVGDEPGPAKMEKAEKYGIPTMDEDQLLDMILERSGMKPKYSKKRNDSDSGLGTSQEENFEPAIKRVKTAKSPKNESKIESPVKKDIKKSNKVSPQKTGKAVENFEPAVKRVKNSKSPKKESKVESPVKKDITKSDKVSIKSPQKTEKTVESQAKSSKESSGKADMNKKEPEKKLIETENLAWTDKYKPTNIKNIIGQQMGTSEMNKLRNWLQNWEVNVSKKTFKRSNDGSDKKCALLSGPPGVGKTTTATLVANDLGFDVVEFNASDTRSKKLLHNEVKQLLGSQTIAGFATGDSKTNKKRVLLMDEVDGMAGNEDRGGVQELIDLIKHTQIPIICMCNDRFHPKTKSLANYCFDLRFDRPKLEQIKGAMMSICFKEGIKISPAALTDIIRGAGCDVRQTLNNLYMWSIENHHISNETAERKSKSAKKDTVPGPWEVVRMVFSAAEHEHMSIPDRSRLFFYDYSLGPLFIQENYIRVTPKTKDRKEALIRMAAASDAISFGAVVEQKIRSTNNWSLLDCQAMFSSVLPGSYLSGNPHNANMFPGWLGKNSKRGKLDRLLTEVQTHIKKRTGASKLAVNLDLVKPLRTFISNLLANGRDYDIEDAIEFMKSYKLTRDDYDSLTELMSFQNTKRPEIQSKVKAAFTRAYNKANPKLDHKPKPKTKRTMGDEDGENVEEEQESEEEDISKNPMIKVKVKKEKNCDNAETSKGKGKGKGKKK